jgi:hypothetical protein
VITKLSSLRIGDSRSREYTAVAVAAFDVCLASTAREYSERPYFEVQDMIVDFIE